VSDVLEPRGEILGAALRLAGGRGLALDRQGGGEYVGWSVYATSDFNDGEPKRLHDVTVAEAIELAPDRREVIVPATLDAIAVLRLTDAAGQAASEVMLRQSERLVDELVEAGLAREVVLSIARRLSRAHVHARDLRGHPARETSANDGAGTLRIERVGARLRRDLERANLSAPALTELLAGEDASRDDIERYRRCVTRWLALDAHRGMSAANAAKVAQALHTDPSRYLSPRFSERYRLEQRVRNLEAKLRQTRDRLARLPPQEAVFGAAEPPIPLPLDAVAATPPGSLRRRALHAAPLVLLLVGLAVLGILLAAGLGRGSHSHARAASPTVAKRHPHPGTRGSRQPRTQVKVVTLPVQLQGLGAWDPYGDGTEHGADAVKAADGEPSTYWPTETYKGGLAKPGVGLVLDAGAPVRLARLVVSTDTPGYTALIEAGASSTGPFTDVSTARLVFAKTIFVLRARASERYYVVWITRLDRIAHVNEVGATRFVSRPG
jgi:hypothetical protein